MDAASAAAQQERQSLLQISTGCIACLWRGGRNTGAGQKLNRGAVRNCPKPTTRIKLTTGQTIYSRSKENRVERNSDGTRILSDIGAATDSITRGQSKKERRTKKQTRKTEEFQGVFACTEQGRDFPAIGAVRTAETANTKEQS